MPPAAISLPPLSVLLQHLAGILPLSALIEFIDIATKVHLFELNGSVALWNWPVTPPGARLLLSGEDTSDACCLDRIQRSIVLHCIDGRYGDWYPSSTPTTTRLCVSAQKNVIVVPNASPNMADVMGRKQRLEVVRVRQQAPELASKSHLPLYRAVVSRLPAHSIKYTFVSAVGWLCLVGLVIISLLAQLYVAAAYLLLMPLTGKLVQFSHGGKARRLLDERASEFQRLVVATSSLNGSEWWAFYGGSFTLNSFLNKPLHRTSNPPNPKLLRRLLRVMIAAQWALIVTSCAQQNWGAFVISFWIAICACVSTYVYPPESSVQDWLQDSCNLSLEKIQAEFSSRRSMLTAMVYLNPDSKEQRTEWIDPILAPSADRKDWESALFAVMATGTSLALLDDLGHYGGYRIYR